MITAKEANKIFRYEESTGYLWWRERGLGRRFTKPVGSVTSPKGYIHVECAGKIYKAHHLIWLMKTGRWSSKQIDHKDTNTKNNRWNNLREATQAQNLANCKMYRTNKSGFKGVMLRKGPKFIGRERWRAVITIMLIRLAHTPTTSRSAQ